MSEPENLQNTTNGLQGFASKADFFLGRMGQFLKKHLPTLYDFLKRPGQKKQGYYDQRQDLTYYDVVRELAYKYGKDKKSIIDIGSADTPLLENLSWFGRRVAIDKKILPKPGGNITCIQADFASYPFQEGFDVALCLQVLEHLADPAVFFKKIMDLCDIAIVSVPYQWPAGMCKWHLQDPVDEKKLKVWTGREPLETRIVQDRKNRRLIAVYGGSAKAQAKTIPKFPQKPPGFP